MVSRSAHANLRPTLGHNPGKEQSFYHLVELGAGPMGGSPWGEMIWLKADKLCLARLREP